MYVCKYVCNMYVCMYVCMYVYVYVSPRGCASYVFSANKVPNPSPHFTVFIDWGYIKQDNKSGNMD